MINDDELFTRVSTRLAHDRLWAALVGSRPCSARVGPGFLVLGDIGTADSQWFD